MATNKATDAAPVVLLEEVCDAAKDTLALYKKHLNTGRYTDADECLRTFRALTLQASEIEQMPRPFEPDADKINMSLLVDGKEIANAVSEMPKQARRR